MEIAFRINADDYKVYYEESWSKQKRSQRTEYYSAALWYLVVLSLAVYFTIKHGEVFATCIFVVFAAFYLRQNWSFERRWRAQVESYAGVIPEHLCHFSADDGGISQRTLGIELRVPWSEIRHYVVRSERLLVHFSFDRLVVVPLQVLSASQRTDLISILEAHNVNQKS